MICPRPIEQIAQQTIPNFYLPFRKSLTDHLRTNQKNLIKKLLFKPKYNHLRSYLHIKLLKMDTLKNLGELALGSRLKRLSEQIMKAGQKVYKSYNLSFDPKWFPVYYSISIKDNTTVMEIADQLGLKHPSVFIVLIYL
jgi:hypothetical protein